MQILAESILYGQLPPGPIEPQADAGSSGPGPIPLPQDVWPLTGSEAFWILSGLCALRRTDRFPEVPAAILERLAQRIPMMFISPGPDYECRQKPVVEALFVPYQQRRYWQLSPIQGEVVLRGLEAQATGNKDTLARGSIAEIKSLYRRLAGSELSRRCGRVHCCGCGQILNPEEIHSKYNSYICDFCSYL